MGKRGDRKQKKQRKDGGKGGIKGGRGKEKTKSGSTTTMHPKKRSTRTRKTPVGGGDQLEKMGGKRGMEARATGLPAAEQGCQPHGKTTLNWGKERKRKHS